MLPGQGFCFPDDKVCNPGEIGACPQGQVCLPTEDRRGECASENCTPGEEERCPEGWQCWDTAHTPPGEGTCVPPNTCTLGDATTCAPNEVCWDTPYTPPGLGTCLPPNTCTLGDATTCAPNEVCWDTSSTPPGFGTCVPGDSCTLDGTWPCEPGKVCQDTLHTPPGMGTCVPEEVTPEPSIVGFELWQGRVAVVPLGEGGSTEGAGWVGSGTGLVEIVTEGPGSDSGLRVWAGSVQADCEEPEQVENIQRYVWKCNFAEGFAAPGPTVTVQSQLGSQAPQSQTYRVELSPPDVSFKVVGQGDEGTGLLGDLVVICAAAQDRPDGPPLAALRIDDIVVDIDGVPLTLNWTEHLTTHPQICRSALLPESIQTLGTLNVSANVWAKDMANNVGKTAESGSLTLSRIAFHTSLNVTDTVMPLVWTFNRLAIGASTPSSGRVYFYNTGNRHFVRDSENVGTLTGMAALGNTGQVAITNNNRVAVVGYDGQLSIAASKCSSGEGLINVNARFPYGPTLLAINDGQSELNWQFAVAVGEPTQGRLLAYTPDISIDSCKLSNPLPGEVLSPLVGVDASFEVMATVQNPLFGATNEPFAHIQLWKHNGASAPFWADTSASTGAIHIDVFDTLRIADIAAHHVPTAVPPYWHFWINAHWENTTVPSSAISLMRGRTDQSTTATMGGTYDSISPMALDAYGRAYVVVKPTSDDYELHRYQASAATGAIPSDGDKVTLAQAIAGPVGSPMLGESRGESLAELYVVTTDGTIYAFEAESLAFLWKHTLLKPNGQPITIAPTAQPVLNGNRLWLVSNDGELYAVVVNSNGLKRAAQWPKMYRDNCNSNSHHSKYTNLPSCF